MVIEVYTPGGNWSSYPPHKHDTHNPPAEVDLDEIYYFRIADPNGFAFQHLYGGKHGSEYIVKARDGDVVLVHSGYHTVVAGPGYDTYYLNFLAGTCVIWPSPTMHSTPGSAPIGENLIRVYRSCVNRSAVKSPFWLRFA
jgi:5-deoxy-glucuronate isomerase